MNKGRRSKLKAIAAQIEARASRLSVLYDEEKRYLDGMPDSAKGALKYDAACYSVCSLGDAIEALRSAHDDILNAAMEPHP